MNILFYLPVGLYFCSMLLQFAGSAFKKNGVKKAAWGLYLAGFAVHMAYIVIRGIKAGRVPMANQFEFATAFSWGTALIGIVLRLRSRKTMEWMTMLCTPCAFLLISYAALQPREITELMPALRSAWFISHIGTAVFSYASFAVAAACSIRYLVIKKREPEESLRDLENLTYKLICFGFLLLTVVLLTGCIWAEQAWGSFWTWDPKEVWALITWIVYSIYLHQRIRMNKRGPQMAWFAIIAFAVVLLTFVGVNTLMKGLHSYS